MDEPIVSQDHARKKAQRAFQDGEHINDCPYNPGLARKIWLAEYHRLEVEAQLARSETAERAAA